MTPDVIIRVKIVPKARKRNFLGRGATADLGISLDYGDLKPGSGQVGGANKAIMTRADDDAIQRFHESLPLRLVEVLLIRDFPDDHF